jgi:hypothetical protein
VFSKKADRLGSLDDWSPKLPPGKSTRMRFLVCIFVEMIVFEAYASEKLER